MGLATNWYFGSEKKVREETLQHEPQKHMTRDSFLLAVARGNQKKGERQELEADVLERNPYIGIQ